MMWRSTTNARRCGPNRWATGGRGAVQLVEIPTPDETFDNIVAFWNPAEPVLPGRELRFNYKLYWGTQPPFQPTVAQVFATRLGVGGMPGQKKTVPIRKFVIDFAGGRLDGRNRETKIEAVVSASRGELRDIVARPLAESALWRCHFDLVASGNEPVDLRCYLRDAEGALSETWLYQWSPLSPLSPV